MLISSSRNRMKCYKRIEIIGRGNTLALHVFKPRKNSKEFSDGTLLWYIKGGITILPITQLQFGEVKFIQTCLFKVVDEEVER